MEKKIESLNFFSTAGFFLYRGFWWIIFQNSTAGCSLPPDVYICILSYSKTGYERFFLIQKNESLKRLSLYLINLPRRSRLLLHRRLQKWMTGMIFEQVWSATKTFVFWLIAVKSRWVRFNTPSFYMILEMRATLTIGSILAIASWVVWSITTTIKGSIRNLKKCTARFVIAIDSKSQFFHFLKNFS